MGASDGVSVDITWILQLGSSGAAALVGAAATDAWTTARSAFVRLLGRGNKTSESLAERRLDALAAEVEQAEGAEREAVRKRLLAVWQTRLSDLLEEDPDLATTMKSVRDDLQARLPERQQQWVQNVIASATGATAQGVMFGSIVNHGTTPAADPGHPLPPP
jgi:hypothetical protein